MKYSVTNLNDKNYNLMGIKLSSGKTCCYWSNKGSNEFDRIIVIFNNKNVVDIRNREVCISLNGIEEEKDILDMIEAFGRELYKNGINITKLNCDFIVDNKDEEEIVGNVIDKFMLKGNVIKSEKYSYLTENLEDAISNISVFADNREKRHSHDLDADSIVSKKKKLLSDWMNDSEMLLKIGYLSKEELDKKLTEAVMGDVFNVDNDLYNENVINNIDDSIDNGITSVKEDEVEKFDYVEDDIKSRDSDVSDIEKSSYDDINLVKEDIPKVSTFSVNREDNTFRRSSNDSSVDDYFWGKDEFKGSSLLSGNDLPVREDLGGSVGSNVRVLKKPDVPVYPRDNKKRKISLPLVIFIISFILLLLSVVILYLIK